jgi:hypothetical protein
MLNIGQSTPKEQKKFLIDAIEKALLEAPDKPIRKKGDLVDLYFKNEQANGTISIQVPDAGRYSILNTKSVLEQFKRKVKNFPSTQMTYKTINPPSTRPTGRRIMDFAGEYTIPYSPKYAPTHLEAKGAYYEDGWYSDGTYLIKSEKPKTKTPYQPMPPPGVRSFLETKDTELYPATLGAEYYVNPTGEKEDNVLHLDVYSQGMPYGNGQNRTEAVFNPEIIDVILKKYPKSETFLRNDGMLFFKVDGETVAAAVRMNLGEGVGISDFAKSRRPINRT